MSEQRPEPRRAKRRILVLCDYYLPSSKGGGGTWTVVNLIERFCDRYEFFVIARNHESRSDTCPFQSVKTNEWNTVGNAQVFYLAPPDFTRDRLFRLIQEISPAGVYLNSVFSKPVVSFLLLLRFKPSIKVPVILAPCGELSEGALGLKRWKKRSFLLLAKSIGLYSAVRWKATSELESNEIRNVFGPHLSLLVAPDLPPKQILPDFSKAVKPPKEVGKAKFIFYSRIDRKKNLLFVLELLAEIDRKEGVEFDIVGHAEDSTYWQECKKTIEKLSPPIDIQIVGAVSNDAGLKLLTGSHFLVLPTLGENFGYVILEALSAGCPVLISDRTIWSDVSEKGAGWSMPLNDKKAWATSISHCIDLDQEQFALMSQNARQLAENWLQSPDLETATEKALVEVFGD
jgi:glycosyltransferase involved in cell wall biosynthesis